MSSPANEFCKVPNTDALMPRWVSYFITSGFVKKWQISHVQLQFASSVFGGSYAGLVSFGLLTACGSSHEFFVVCELSRQRRLSSHTTVAMSRRWRRGDLNSCIKCFANEDVLIAL